MNKTDLNILLAEDDLLTQRTTKKLLARFGNVTTASNYEDALNFLKTQKFDIAYFDLNMDGSLAGLELIKAANEIQLYTVVISGESRSDILEKAFNNNNIK